jgi:hypothetical protein
MTDFVNNTPTFVATRVDRTHIYYKCPVCFTKYKKNGQPYANAKNVIHKHGSCGDLSNRIEHRAHHRTYNYPEGRLTYNNVCIIIDDTTKKINE